MLKLDPFSENVLFQCERCRFVGELITAIVEEEGCFYCWNCLNEIDRAVKKEKQEQYAVG